MYVHTQQHSVHAVWFRIEGSGYPHNITSNNPRQHLEVSVILNVIAWYVSSHSIDPSTVILYGTLCSFALSFCLPLVDIHHSASGIMMDHYLISFTCSHLPCSLLVRLVHPCSAMPHPTLLKQCQSSWGPLHSSPPWWESPWHHCWLWQVCWFLTGIRTLDSARVHVHVLCAHTKYMWRHNEECMWCCR